MWAPKRGLTALSSSIVRRFTSYGSIRYASSVEAPAVVEEAGDHSPEEAKPKKKRSPRKKANKAAAEDESGATPTEKKSSSNGEEQGGGEAKVDKKKKKRAGLDNLSPPLLKTLRTLKEMVVIADGNQEVLQKKLAEYSGPLTLAALERARVGSSPDVALNLFRWAATRPEFCDQPKSVHRFISVLRANDKLEEVRAFVAEELQDLPEAQQLAYSAVYVGYLNGDNDEKAEEVLAEMTKRGITPHDSALNRLLLIRMERQGVDAMLDLYREHRAKGWQLGATGYNQVILGLTRADKVDEALEVVLESAGKVEHQLGSFQMVMMPLCSSGRLDDALKLADAMFATIGVRSGAPLRQLVNRLVEAKRYDDALQLFERIIKVAPPRGLKIVNGLVRVGELDHAIEVAELMKKYEVKGDMDFKFLVIKLCDAKRLDDARKVFDIMVGAGESPDAETCTKLAMSSGKMKAEENKPKAEDEAAGGDDGDEAGGGSESEVIKDEEETAESRN